ncbi:putative protein OS=Streptomyces tendae OX=1932 GN=GUR47_09210 PE=4 SV=1 [Streptomyces tendae]
MATTRASRPASACSGRSTGIAAIVVQFGLAMMPLGRSAIACGFTSETTRGTRDRPTADTVITGDRNIATARARVTASLPEARTLTCD